MRTGDRQASADRRTLVLQLLGTTVAAVLWGMAAGALTVSSGRRTAALIGAGLLLTIAVTVMSVVWYRERRRAREAGLATSRYLRLAQRLRRGVIPDHPAERQAAAAILARQSRALEQWKTGNRQIAYGTGAVQVLAAAMQRGDRAYGLGALLLFAAACSFSNPAMSRRQQRRNEATCRALRRRYDPEGGRTDEERHAASAPADGPDPPACRPTTRTTHTSPERGAHPAEEN
ncbi:hypothetical protein MMF93_11455 [Streptomyces tubbatahanensis]|uniref:Uncharacterized protein n=1 Tax=Streptomyces tubbatahanensis TaxID=2923272 RepID=A0ABY3XRM9_9ACTN|nr:hypothetical protein [Streptomyces tubbatahanensis]UNS97055.1 hypothetical protein MMF93_11455 [Streptomyces tubbatahanensis]